MVAADFADDADCIDPIRVISAIRGRRYFEFFLSRVALGSATFAHSTSYTQPESSQTRPDICF